MTFFENAGRTQSFVEKNAIEFALMTGMTQSAVNKQKRWGRRLTDSGIYAILSITAKVALDFGFLALIFVRAQEPVLKTIHNAVNNAITAVSSDAIADTVNSIPLPGDSP